MTQKCKGFGTWSAGTLSGRSTSLEDGPQTTEMMLAPQVPGWVGLAYFGHVSAQQLNVIQTSDANRVQPIHQLAGSKS